MITPTNDYEERVPVKFIKSVQEKLRRQRSEAIPQSQTLLMDNSYMFGVSFPYASSSLELDRLVIPDSLNLSFLKLI